MMSGAWQSLANQPSFNASTMLLLTDGTVLCHEVDVQGNGTSSWHKLSPNQYGSYYHGTWSSVKTGPNSPLYFASAVMKDGRVFIAGGEYNGGDRAELLAPEIYDPIIDVWITLSTPHRWTEIGDAACCMMPDGKILLAPPGRTDKRTAIYDPVTNMWTSAANKIGPSSHEETWVLLPDQTILTCNCYGHPHTEKYLIAADQ